MAPPRIAVVAPPPLKPSEPGVSGGAAAAELARRGAVVRWFDASLGWHRFALHPDRLQRNLDAAAGDLPTEDRQALRRGLDSGRATPHRLRRRETYADRDVYSSAVNDLENALRAAALPFPGWRLGIAMAALEHPSRRLESSAVLEWTATSPGPFDAYFLDDLLPELAGFAPDVVAVSLTFQQQAPAAFRLARLLAERLPAARRVLGGPLPACWLAAGFPLHRPPFTSFHELHAGTVDDLDRLAGAAAPPPDAPLTVPLDQAPWDDYLVPSPVVPAALGRGCYWRRCTFCPDHLHPPHAACAADGLERWLHGIAARFPAGAMLHLTDSALPPGHLARLATAIRDQRLPLRWHGFVRAEPELAEPELARTLADGGCAMLQLGVETAAPRLGELLGKGTDPELVRRVLRATAAAGIRNQVYLLFGLPTETDAEREATLAFVEAESDAIHAVNPALLNLPKGSPMHRRPERFGITELVPFGAETDLSLYDDFRCGASHPRPEARRWLGRRLFKSPALQAIQGRLRQPFKANHLCFLER